MSIKNLTTQGNKWKNLSWITLAEDDGWSIIILQSLQAHKNLPKFLKIVPQAINDLQSVLPANPNYTKEVKIALFPKEKYRKNLELTDDIPMWVQACCRDEKICYDISIADTWGHNTTTMPPDHRRELIHEITHEIYPCFSFDTSWVPLSVREGAVEVIPRVMLGEQKNFPDSNKYIDDIREELINPKDIDNNGLFFYSQQPLNFNSAYLSSTVYVAGLAIRLGKGNIKQGIIFIKELAEELQNQELFKSNIATHLGYQNYEGIDFASIQKEGVDCLIGNGQILD